MTQSTALIGAAPTTDVKAHSGARLARQVFTPTRQQTEVLQKLVSVAQNRESATATGHAGSGKTSLISRMLIPALRREGLKVAITAYTHQACVVIRRKLEKSGIYPATELGVQVMTSSRLLGFREEEKGNGETSFQPLGTPKVDEFDAVIADEASMLPGEHVRMLQQLCRKHGVACIYVGDPAQLPPVGHKSDTSPAFELEIPQFHLSEIHRNAGAILALATAARECEPGKIPPFLQATDSYSRVVVHPSRMNMRDAVEAKLLDGRASEESQTLAIISCTNHAAYEWNKFCRDTVLPGAAPFECGDLLRSRNAISDWTKAALPQQPPLTGASAELQLIREPEQIEFPLKNKILQGLVKTPCWLLHAVCDQSEDPLQLLAVAPEDVQEIERIMTTLKNEASRKPKDDRGPYWGAFFTLRRSLGHFVGYRYAMTAHKSQGGEWPCVFVDMADISEAARKWLKPSEHRALMYVAFTRASRELHVIGG